MVDPRPPTRTEDREPPQRLAVLIDADNAQAAILAPLLAEIARYGEATVKRIYGDFTAPASAQWKKVLNKLAIKPVQQFAYTTGKNATDSALIIDAMDLLYTQRFDGFCLVSSDSDFTGLALRIREQGLTVLGFGEAKTPEAFRNACHKFVLTEVFRAPEPEPTQPRTTARGQPAAGKAAAERTAQPKTAGKGLEGFPRDAVLTALDQASDDTGWAQIGTFGSHLNRLQPDFDSRHFGYKKLSDLVRAMTELFEFEERKSDASGNKMLYLRARTPED